MPAPGSRLATLLAAVPRGASFADVACDHGRLAIAVACRDPDSRVIASDLRHGPLDAARRKVAATGLDGRIELRLGDGLAVLAPGEVDVVCIAGLGGPAIVEMLESAPAVVATARRLVLQPLTRAGRVRRALLAMRWAGRSPHVVAEDFVVERGYGYEVIVVEPRVGADPAYPDDPDARAAALDCGPHLLASRNAALRRRWNGERDRLARLAVTLAATDGAVAPERLAAVEAGAVAAERVVAALAARSARARDVAIAFAERRNQEPPESMCSAESVEPAPPADAAD